MIITQFQFDITQPYNYPQYICSPQINSPVVYFYVTLIQIPSSWAIHHQPVIPAIRPFRYWSILPLATAGPAHNYHFTAASLSHPTAPSSVPVFMNLYDQDQFDGLVITVAVLQ